MPLFWTPESVQDREGIYDFIEADNPVAALEMDEMFSKKALRLLDHPGLGRLGRVAVRANWWCMPTTFWFTK